jgi:hypothetical protein
MSTKTESEKSSRVSAAQIAGLGVHPSCSAEAVALTNDVEYQMSEAESDIQAGGFIIAAARLERAGAALRKLHLLKQNDSDHPPRP